MAPFPSGPNLFHWKQMQVYQQVSRYRAIAKMATTQAGPTAPGHSLHEEGEAYLAVKTIYLMARMSFVLYCYS